MGPVESNEGTSVADVYRDSYARLARLAHLITGSPTAAEELVQDAFVQLIRRWDDLSNPEGYLRVAVVNGCRSWQRRRVLERTHPPERAASVDSEVDELRDALAKLSVRQRTAVVLRYYLDMPEAEIARSIGCRPGTVKSTLSRALAKLGESLTND